MTVSVNGPPRSPGPPQSPGPDRAPPATITVVVEDDGEGIPAPHLGRVFERFYQVDRGGAQKGAGIGLAIVAELVRAMGGRVDAESPVTLSGGTRMIVRLPAAAGTG